MSKMCGTYKELKEGNPKKYIDMIGEGRYLCKRCGRVAGEAEYLCCPVERDRVKGGEALYCSVEGCPESTEEKRKVKKMTDDELRELVREEVYNTVKLILQEEKELGVQDVEDVE